MRACLPPAPRPRAAECAPASARARHTPATLSRPCALAPLPPRPLPPPPPPSLPRQAGAGRGRPRRRPAHGARRAWSVARRVQPSQRPPGPVGRAECRLQVNFLGLTRMGRRVRLGALPQRTVAAAQPHARCPACPIRSPPGGERPAPVTPATFPLLPQKLGRRPVAGGRGGRGWATGVEGAHGRVGPAWWCRRAGAGRRAAARRPAGPPAPASPCALPCRPSPHQSSPSNPRCQVLLKKEGTEEAAVHALGRVMLAAHGHLAKVRRGR